MIIPVGATASSRIFTDSRDDPANLINGNGFTVASPIENSTHTNENWNSGAQNWGWIGGQTPGTTIDFDLGAAYNVGFAHVWNWNGAADTFNWGIAAFNLVFSRDAIYGNGDDTTLSFVIGAATGLPDYTGSHYSFASQNDVTNIRLVITDNLPGNDLAGLSEVRFSESVPEPSVFFSSAVSAIVLFIGMRRRS